MKTENKRPSKLPRATLVRWHNLTEGEKVDRLAKAISNIDANDRATYLEMARACVAALEGKQ